MAYGVEHAEQSICPVAVAHEHAGDGCPNRGVSVLPPVLAYARQVAFYVAGVLWRFIEGRCEEQKHLLLLQHKLLFNSLHGLFGALGLRSPRNNAPALCD